MKKEFDLENSFEEVWTKYDKMWSVYINTSKRKSVLARLFLRNTPPYNKEDAKTWFSLGFLHGAETLKDELLSTLSKKKEEENASTNKKEPKTV